MRRVIALFSLVSVLVFPCVAAELSLEQQAAKERGLMLYNQHKAISAEPYLREAAEAGDREAQYFLGEALRFNSRYMTDEAYKWYATAAEQGDYYAMYRLARTSSDLCAVMGNCSVDSKAARDWLLLGQKTAKELAAQGDADAMYVLYYLTSRFEWLEKAAEAGSPEAQHDLARYYQKGSGFFFLPWKRSERVAELLRRSAESMYVPSIEKYMGILYERGDLAGVRYWLEQAAELGYESAVGSLGAYLAHVPDELAYPLDLVKGYGLVSLLLELDGDGNAKWYAETKLPLIAAKMTPEQIEQANAFAEEWKATHPPLSFFPGKLGF